jgi:predicted nuclease with RNAse H fold
MRKQEEKPSFVGIDLSGSPARPTGWAALHFPLAKSVLLHSDAEILQHTLAARPRVVAIDAPLSLPSNGGIIRESERELMALRIGVYPCLLPSMRALTHRGIALKQELEAHGLTVIEGFPGAAQDALGIPRKKTSQSALRDGLANLGLQLPAGKISHHELDANTAALIARYYANGEYHAIGPPTDVQIIIPCPGHRSIHLHTDDAPTLRYAANYLALFHATKLTTKGPRIEIPAFRKRPELRIWLAAQATPTAPPQTPQCL